MAQAWRCRIGLHYFTDFPDPNPESGGLEKQNYQACMRCTKVRDAPVYLWMSGTWRLPDGRR